MMKKSNDREQMLLGGSLSYRSLHTLFGVNQKTITELRGTPTLTRTIRTKSGNVRVALYKRLNGNHKVKTCFYFLQDELFAISSHYPYATSSQMTELSRLFLGKLHLEGSYALDRTVFHDPLGWTAYSTTNMGFHYYMVHRETIHLFL